MHKNTKCTSTSEVCADKTLPNQDQIDKENEQRCSLHKGTMAFPHHHLYFYGPKMGHIQAIIDKKKRQFEAYARGHGERIPAYVELRYQ